MEINKFRYEINVGLITSQYKRIISYVLIFGECLKYIVKYFLQNVSTIISYI
jgi:hypothetical protein